MTMCGLYHINGTQLAALLIVVGAWRRRVVYTMMHNGENYKITLTASITNTHFLRKQRRVCAAERALAEV